MNKKYLLASLFVASLGTTSIASAGDTYVGFGIGNSSSDIDIDGIDFDIDNATGWKIFGGYAFNNVLAVEGGYTSFGEADLSIPGLVAPGLSMSAEPTGFEIATVVNFPINSQFSLFGKIGLLAWDVELSASFLGDSISESDTGTDTFYGIGGQYEISDNLAARASWESYTMDYLDVDLLSASAIFSF